MLPDPFRPGDIPDTEDPEGDCSFTLSGARPLSADLAELGLQPLESVPGEDGDLTSRHGGDVPGAGPQRRAGLRLERPGPLVGVPEQLPDAEAGP